MAFCMFVNDSCARSGPAEGIGGFVLQLFFHSKEITFGQGAVRIQYYQVFALASFHPVVTGLPGAGVGLVIVMYVQ